MSGNRSNNGFLVIVLLTVALVAYLTRNQKLTFPSLKPKANTETVLIATSLASGVKYSSTMACLNQDIQRLKDTGKLHLIISSGKLPNPVLGQTTVTLNADSTVIECTIVIDTEDAVVIGDRVEPLLGHELKHVWDALFLYDKDDPIESVKKFIETANAGKKTIYRDREVESSAISVEDKIRKELVGSGATEFKTLPISREQADEIYAIRSKSNLSLKSVLAK